MPEVEVTITASAVAWYAAIVATTSLAVSVIKVWRDRPRIRVSARSGFQVIGGGPAYPPDKTYISVDVVNDGRRPVTLKCVLLLQGKGEKEILLGDSMVAGGTELGEGRSVSFTCDQDRFDLEKIQKVMAVGVTGKKWTGPFTQSD